MVLLSSADTIIFPVSIYHENVMYSYGSMPIFEPCVCAVGLINLYTEKKLQTPLMCVCEEKAYIQAIGVCVIARNADCWVPCRFYPCAVLVATPELETEFEHRYNKRNGIGNLHS